MPPFADNVSEAVEDFRRVAVLAGHSLILDDLREEICLRPHVPSPLPSGMMAVYAFFWNGRALKVGKVGAKSGPRYVSQHYNHGSARSTLSGSILANPDRVGLERADAHSIGAWIKENTDRVNLILSASHGLEMLSLLEAFLHVRWKPVYEGRGATHGIQGEGGIERQ